MSTLTGLGLLLLATFAPTQPAADAGKLSVPTLNARLAAKPTGANAQALAEDIHAWFGKDRAGRDNVAGGANPKIVGLETAWAIEAPGAKTAAVVLGDGKSLPLTRIGETPIFAATAPFAHGSGLTWTYVVDGSWVQAARDRSKPTPTSPSSPRSPASPRAR